MEIEKLTINIDNVEYNFEDIKIVPYLQFIEEISVNYTVVKVKDIVIGFESCYYVKDGEKVFVSEYDSKYDNLFKKYFMCEYEDDLIEDYENGGTFEEYKEDDYM